MPTIPPPPPELSEKPCYYGWVLKEEHRNSCLNSVAGQWLNRGPTPWSKISLELIVEGIANGVRFTLPMCSVGPQEGRVCAAYAYWKVNRITGKWGITDFRLRGPTYNELDKPLKEFEAIMRLGPNDGPQWHSRY